MSHGDMSPAYSGALHGSIIRDEDDRLLRGEGAFVANISTDRQVVGVFVRSPHANARIVSIDFEDASRQPGVLAILTAKDIDHAGVGSITRLVPIGGNDTTIVSPDWPALARDRVVHVGQAVVLVVAETRNIAEDAVELVAIDYEPLPAVVGIREAMAPEAPQLWPAAPGNAAVEWAAPVPEGMVEKVKAAIADAPHVVRMSLVDQRIAPSSLEPRCATADFDAARDQYVLRCGCQSVWIMRSYMAAILGVEPERLRVISDDVGGAFGMKSPPYPEYAALLVATKMLGRPVQWVSTRSEAFVSDNHARDMILNGELALDKKGRFLALNVEVLANMGAFLSATGPLTATVNIALCLPSVYNIPLIANTSHCVFTNSVPTGAYRGAGRPEANFLIERLIDAAALLTRIDKVELRRRNFLSPDMLPYRTPLGMTFDGGEFSEVLNKALELSDYGTFLTRRKLANKCGKMRGIGIGVFLEQTGGSLQEGSAVAFAEAGEITLQLGSQASGQGHKTVFRDMLAQRLGISRDCIVVKLGDTNAKVVGMGAVGSRSAVMVSGAMAKTVDSMLEKGRKVASLMLEADDADIVFANGTFSAVGTDLSVSLFDVAAKAVELKTLGQLDETLDTNLTTETPPTFPNGCHIAEVEIDPETGELELVAYTAVQDIGRVLNPVIAAGQVRGGVAQGVGQVLKEAVSYEAGSGQLQSASFMDYGIPRASNVPDAFKVAFVEVPSTTNPYGVKGVAESGTTGSLGALMNAIVDALPEDVGTALTMPVTPSKLWTLLNRERTCPELLG